ncbi:MAG TPA: alpha/beta fold hydrolase [Acidobacteriaceae bacterium]|jgi:pimeloyl-ACP methyl ester carboxylesterase
MSELLHYEERGHGPCVVFLHPTPVDHCFWRPAAALLDPDYRVLLPDLPGHGLSPLGNETTSMETMGQAVLRLLDALSVAGAIFYGCSIGGYLLYELWRQAPERIRALAICSAKPHADTPETRRTREATIEVIEQRGTGPFFDSMLDTLVGAPAKERDPEIVHRLCAMMERMSAASAIAVQRALAARPDSRATAATIRVPTAVLAASLDRGSTPQEMRELANTIPGSTFHLLREMGHYAPYEQPRLVGALLRRFADENTAH